MVRRLRNVLVLALGMAGSPAFASSGPGGLFGEGFLIALAFIFIVVPALLLGLASNAYAYDLCRKLARGATISSRKLRVGSWLSLIVGTVLFILAVALIAFFWDYNEIYLVAAMCLGLAAMGGWNLKQALGLRGQARQPRALASADRGELPS